MHSFTFFLSCPSHIVPQAETRQNNKYRRPEALNREPTRRSAPCLRQKTTTTLPEAYKCPTRHHPADPLFFCIQDA
ncbi:hypothetical protein BJX66DRAFT_95586 [Aspergillus keveii]|uniref:Uncharacterized protein n=1 Tax=Aspergillus keveii TaxID=714993 RepID=A0ABR4FLP5_9EURO